MRFTLKIWHVVPAGALLMLLAALGALAVAPRPTTATFDGTLAVMMERESSAGSIAYEAPVTMRAPAPEMDDPFAKTDRLLDELAREAGK